MPPTRHAIEQPGHVSGASSSTGGDSTGRAFTPSLDSSLTANVLRNSIPDPGHTRSHTVHLHQVYDKHIEQHEGSPPPYTARVRNERTAADTVNLNFSGGHVRLGGSRNQASTQTFDFTDSLGDCYKAELKAEGDKVTSINEGRGCNGKQLL